MENLEFPITALELGRIFGAPLVGDGKVSISRLASLQTAGKGTLAYFSNKKYGADLERVSGGVVLTTQNLARRDLPVTYILVEDPQGVFASIARRFIPPFPWKGLSPQALIHPSAVLAENVDIAPFAIIGENVRIGRGTRISPYVYLAKDVSVGELCEIHPQVTVLDSVTVGNRVKIFSGSVLGSDGFGLFDSGHGGGRSEMPQIGTVVIEDDVRIGANCTVDRSTLGTTRVGRGTKMDDHVHVGHNAQVGPNCVLCGAVALGGSVVLEEDVILAGQVGVGHGCTIGSGARLGGQCGTTTNLPGNETYSLMPATPIRDVTRIVRYWRRLPEMWKRLRRIEKQLGIEAMDEGQL